MSLFLRWIQREVRNDRWWVCFFILSLTLGLFGFVGLESFRAGLETALQSNAKKFLSADLSASARRLITNDEINQIKAKTQATEESHLTEFLSMAAVHGNSRLVQLKAIDDNYPLYGELELASGKVARKGDAAVLASAPIVWVYPELMVQLKIKVGDAIKIGDLSFTVADVVNQDSTQTFRLGGLAPKIYLARNFLPQTGLLGFGTTFSDTYLFAMPEKTEAEIEKVNSDLKKAFRDPSLQFSTPFDSAQDSARGLQTLLDYLGLVSLVGLALALVGLGYLIQLFLNRRIVTLSLLRTLGLRAARAEIFLILELGLLGLFASILVLALTSLLLPLLAQVVTPYLPLPIQLSVGANAALICLLLATGLPMLIAWPLLKPLRKVNLKQVLLDRQLWSAPLGAKDLLGWLPALLLFFGLAGGVAHSWRTGGFFVLALMASAAIILTLAILFLRAVPLLGRGWVAHHVKLRLTRAPLRFGVVTLAIAFGTLLLVLLPQIRSSLETELASPQSAKLPSLFMFDIQDEQLNSLVDFLKKHGQEPKNISPLIRARILSVNDQTYERVSDRGEFASREEETEARFRNRGVNLSFRQNLSESEELDTGRLFSASVGKIAELSIEKKYAERVGMKLGDVIKFDVQGVPIEGQVVNLRSVKWNSFQPNFFITFQRGFLDEAPKIWLMSISPLPEGKKEELQNGLVAEFPNVSIVDVSRVIKKVLELTTQMTAALTAMAILSVIVGLFVLLTVQASEVRNRLVEWNLYKVLGARQNLVTRLFLLENATLSLVAVVLGAGLGCAIGFALMHWFFEAGFVFDALAFAWACLVPFILTFALSWWLGSRLIRTESASLLAEGRL